MFKTFYKYTSIENPKEKYLSEFFALGYTKDTDEWVAMEKIHGSNFSFITDGDNIKVARRSSVISEDEKFHEWQEIRAKYSADVVQIFAKVKDNYTSDVKSIQIFGELFGGYYPGKKQIRNPVQKGVYYNDEIDFLVFDIRVDSEEDSYYLAQDEVISCLEGLPLLRGIEIMARGKLADLLKIETDFVTKIPTLYHLPPIEGNLSEGLVIKLNQRHSIKKINRPIIKNKNKKFYEHVKVTDHRESFALAEKIIPYCTQNRFNNVISKIGIDRKIEALKGKYIADVFDDFQKDEPAINKTCVKQIKMNIHSYLNKTGLVEKWIKEYTDPIDPIDA